VGSAQVGAMSARAQAVKFGQISSFSSQGNWQFFSPFSQLDPLSLVSKFTPFRRPFRAGPMQEGGHFLGPFWHINHLIKLNSCIDQQPKRRLETASARDSLWLERQK